MTVTLSTAYVSNLKKGQNQPCTIIEAAFTNGTMKWGTHSGGFPDVKPIIKSVTSFQNRIDPKSGFSTRGTISVVVSGRQFIKEIVSPELLSRITEASDERITEDGDPRITESALKYINNRRISVKQGFVGMAYADYVTTFEGKLIDWKRKGDELTLIIADDMEVTKNKIPVENANKTQTLDYRSSNPVDIMHDVLSTQMSISTVYIDSAQFTAEKNTWYNNYIFSRVLTKPVPANQILSELQRETNSFIVHDGNKISFKAFSPNLPGQTIQSWSDDNNILMDTLTQNSGYNDNFYNRVIVLYDYDESGSDDWGNYESAYIAQDSSSMSTSEWNETNTKEIKSKWMRSFTYTQPSNVSGVTLYHVSIDNGLGSGTLTFATGATAHTLSWQAPNSTLAGEAIKLNKAGAFQLFDSDTSKSIRAIVETTSLPAGSTSDTISITQLNGGGYAASLANRTLARYRDPVSMVSFEIDMNDMSYNNQYLKPTDIKNLTTREAFDIESTAWINEPVMITGVRPNGDRVGVEAIQTKLFRKYGFIASTGFPAYSSASDAQKEYAFIADSSGMLEGSTKKAYYIW